MAIPLRDPYFRPATVGIALLITLLAGCASAPRQYAPVNLDRPPARFSLGRVTVVLTDEYGVAMPGMMVNLSWEEPIFYKTSGFTNRDGEVTFAGVPDVAQISVDYPGGLYERILLVPQSGRPELRVTLDTMGEGLAMREREKARMMPSLQPTLQPR